jgi:hypothetical protein
MWSGIMIAIRDTPLEGAVRAWPSSAWVTERRSVGDVMSWLEWTADMAARLIDIVDAAYFSHTRFAN